MKKTGTPAERRRAEQAGRLAEYLALGYLVLTGHRILARRFRSPAGEIDLIVRRGSLIIFCEVKFRHDVSTRKPVSDDGLPSPRQRQRICRTAQEFLKQRHVSPEFECRIDLIQISRVSAHGGWPLSHLRDAWWCDQI